MTDQVKATVFLERELHLDATMLAKRAEMSLSRFVSDLVAKAVAASKAKAGKKAKAA